MNKFLRNYTSLIAVHLNRKHLKSQASYFSNLVSVGPSIYEAFDWCCNLFIKTFRFKQTKLSN